MTEGKIVKSISNSDETLNCFAKIGYSGRPYPSKCLFMLIENSDRLHEDKELRSNQNILVDLERDME
jgi:hypothetical protein